MTIYRVTVKANERLTDKMKNGVFSKSFYIKATEVGKLGRFMLERMLNSFTEYTVVVKKVKCVYPDMELVSLEELIEGVSKVQLFYKKVTREYIYDYVPTVNIKFPRYVYPNRFMCVDYCDANCLFFNLKIFTKEEVQQLLQPVSARYEIRTSKIGHHYIFALTNPLINSIQKPFFEIVHLRNYVWQIREVTILSAKVTEQIIHIH